MGLRIENQFLLLIYDLELRKYHLSQRHNSWLSRAIPLCKIQCYKIQLINSILTAKYSAAQFKSNLNLPSTYSTEESEKSLANKPLGNHNPTTSCYSLVNRDKSFSNSRFQTIGVNYSNT